MSVKYIGKDNLVGKGKGIKEKGCVRGRDSVQRNQQEELWLLG